MFSLRPQYMCEVVINSLQDEQHCHGQLERQWTADVLLGLWDVQLYSAVQPPELLAIMGWVYSVFGVEIRVVEGKEEGGPEAEEEDEWLGLEADYMDAALGLVGLAWDG